MESMAAKNQASGKRRGKEARKTDTRQPREGRHSLPEGKCRQKF